MVQQEWKLGSLVKKFRPTLRMGRQPSSSTGAPHSKQRGGGCCLTALFCDRFNSIAIGVILLGFLLEFHMSLYTATFLTDATTSSSKSRITTHHPPVSQRGMYDDWKPRVVLSPGQHFPAVHHESLFQHPYNGCCYSWWRPWTWWRQWRRHHHHTTFDNNKDDDDSWIHPSRRNRTRQDYNHHHQFLRSPMTLFTDECIPQAKWQTTSQTTCNVLHEMHVPELSLLSMKGSWRSVWKVNSTTHDLVVLKLLHLKREFTPDAYYYAKMDSMAMEHLTFSPYVVNVFGFCGQSVVTEYASLPARDVIKDGNLSSTERLTMARDLAQALSDVHTGRSGRWLDEASSSSSSSPPLPPTLAHLDINIANVVHMNGVLKLNDFNLAMLIPWNVTSQSNCGIVSHFSAPLWKSPEEIANTTLIDPDRSDVYALGNLLFQVLTKHQPWTHLEPEPRPTIADIIQRKLNGQLPHLPKKFVHRNKTQLDAIYFATVACLEPQASLRISAWDLAQALDMTLFVSTLSQRRNLNRAQLQGLFFNATYRRLMLGRYRALRASFESPPSTSSSATANNKASKRILHNPDV